MSCCKRCVFFLCWNILVSNICGSSKSIYPWSFNLWLKSNRLKIICKFWMFHQKPRNWFFVFQKKCTLYQIFVFSFLNLKTLQKCVFQNLRCQFWFYDFLMVFLTYQIDTSEQTFLMVQNILTYQFCCRGEGEKTHFFPPPPAWKVTISEDFSWAARHPGVPLLSTETECRYVQ